MRWLCRVSGSWVNNLGMSHWGLGRCGIDSFGVYFYRNCNLQKVSSGLVKQKITFAAVRDSGKILG